jgi:hypothetical protein
VTILKSGLLRASFTAAALVTATAAGLPAQVRAWFGGAYAAIDPEWANDRGIGETTGGFHFGVGGKFLRHVTLDGEFGGLFPSDKRKFTQDVVCVGDCSANSGGRKTSTIELFTWTAALGLQSPRMGRGPVGLSPLLRLGAANYNARRVISGCADCTVQNLSLRAGWFSDAGITLALGRPERSNLEGMLSFVYRAFLSSDTHFKNVLISLGFTGRRGSG